MNEHHEFSGNPAIGVAHFMERAVMAYSRLILFLIVSSVTFSAFAYQPPVGIPEPVWGTLSPIDAVAPPQPAGWPAVEVTNHYYIDNTSASATDTSNPFGYPDKPRLTVPFANANSAPMPAGTYMEIHGGPYPDHLYFKMACTEASPCWIAGDATTKPTFTGDMVVDSSTYVFVQNLDFNGGSRGAIFVTGVGNHISIRNVDIRNRTHVNLPSTDAISIVPSIGGTMSDVVVYRCTFSNLGDWQRIKDLDFVGISPNTWGRDVNTWLSNVWLLENSFNKVSSGGVIVNGGNWANSHNHLHHVYIGRNEGSQLREALVFVKQASDVIISENTAYNQHIAGNRVQPTDGFAFQYNPNNLWIIFNHVYDADTGIRQSDTSLPDDNHVHNVYLVGNLIHDIHNDPSIPPTDNRASGKAIDLAAGGMTRHVVDNTIYDVRWGIVAQGVSPIDMYGNIIARTYVKAGSSNRLAAGFAKIHDPAREGIATMDYNLFYNPDNSFELDWNWIDYDGLTTGLYPFATSTQFPSGQCAHCLYGDPGFVQPILGADSLVLPHDFRLISTSIAASANNDLSIVPTPDDPYETFKNLYGIDILQDIQGRVRPQNGRALGAYRADVAAPLSGPTLNVR